MQNTNFNAFNINNVNAARMRLELNKLSRRDYLNWLARYCDQAGVEGHTEIVHEAGEPETTDTRVFIPLKAYLAFTFEQNGEWFYAHGRARKPQRDMFQIARLDAQANPESFNTFELAA